MNLYHVMLKILDHYEMHRKQDLKIVDKDLIIVERNFQDPMHI